MTTRLTSPCGRYSCWIELDDKTELPVYQEQKDEHNISGYIPSVVEQTYSIRFKAIKPSPDLEFPDFVCQYTVDGRSCGKDISSPSGYLNPCISTTTKSGAQVGEYLRPFKFAGVELAENGARPTQDQIRSLGLIKMTVVRAKYGTKHEQPPNVLVAELGAIAENATKATVGSVTGFAPPKPSKYNSVRGITYHPADDQKTNPFLTFTFHHASMDMLCAKGIAPQLAKVEPEEPEQEQEQEDPEEQAEIARLEQELQNQLQALEQRKNAGKKRAAPLDEKPDIKPQIPVQKRRKVKSEREDSVIDLTSD